MKKNKILVLLTIFALFIGINNVKAVTYSLEEQEDLNRLGAQIEILDSNATLAYIVGEHVFFGTRVAPFSSKDLMLGARTVDVPGAATTNIAKRDYMNVYQLVKDSQCPSPYTTLQCALNPSLYVVNWLVTDRLTPTATVEGEVDILYFNLDGVNPSDAVHTISFEWPVGVFKKVYLQFGATITAPANPTKAGYLFEQWIVKGTEALPEVLAPNSTVAGDEIYVPTWLEIIDANGIIEDALAVLSGSPVVEWNGDAAGLAAIPLINLDLSNPLTKLSDVTEVYDVVVALLANSEVKSVTLSLNSASETFTTTAGAGTKIRSFFEEMTGKDFADALINDIIGKEFFAIITLEDGYTHTPNTSSPNDPITNVPYVVAFNGTAVEASSAGVKGLTTADTTYVAAMLTDLGYTLNETIAIDSNLKATGTLVKEDVSFMGPGSYEGYFFPFVVELPAGKTITDYPAATITVQGMNAPKTIGTASFTTDKGEWWLVEVNPALAYIKVTIDLDGAGDAYAPTEYRIDLSELVYSAENETDLVALLATGASEVHITDLTLTGTVTVPNGTLLVVDGELVNYWHINGDFTVTSNATLDWGTGVLVGTGAFVELDSGTTLALTSDGTNITDFTLNGDATISKIAGDPFVLHLGMAFTLAEGNLTVTDGLSLNLEGNGSILTIESGATLTILNDARIVLGKDAKIVANGTVDDQTDLGDSSLGIVNSLWTRIAIAGNEYVGDVLVP